MLPFSNMLRQRAVNSRVQELTCSCCLQDKIARVCQAAETEHRRNCTFKPITNAPRRRQLHNLLVS